MALLQPTTTPGPMNALVRPYAVQPRYNDRPRNSRCSLLICLDPAHKLFNQHGFEHLPYKHDQTIRVFVHGDFANGMTPSEYQY